LGLEEDQYTSFKALLRIHDIFGASNLRIPDRRLLFMIIFFHVIKETSDITDLVAIQNPTQSELAHMHLFHPKD